VLRFLGAVTLPDPHMPNPAVNSDVPVKVFVLVDVSGGTPVTSFR
jgi:hypothetical protein